MLVPTVLGAILLAGFAVYWIMSSHRQPAGDGGPTYGPPNPFRSRPFQVILSILWWFLLAAILGLIVLFGYRFYTGDLPWQWTKDAREWVVGSPATSGSPAAPTPAYCGPARAAKGLCPSGSAPAPSAAQPVVVPVPAPPAPLRATVPTTPDLAAIKMPRSVCERKEVLTDFPLTKDGVTLVFKNPSRCKSSFIVKSGTVRVTYAGNLFKDITSTTCPVGTRDPSCAVTVPPLTITSLSASSVLTLEVEPIR